MQYTWINCPSCGFKRFLRVCDTTTIVDLPAYCRRCKKQIWINYKPEHKPSQSITSTQ